MLLLLKITRHLHCILFTFCTAASIAQDGIIKGIVKDPETVLQSVTISISNKTILTNVKGEFSITLKPGTYIILISHVGYSQIEQSLTLNAGETKLFEFNMERKTVMDEMDEVVVLGSRSFVQRSSLNTAVPVDMISSGQLKQTAQISLMQMLSFAAPSFN
ncbi:MAG TPA: carboxypeptidase-like regulatory domain-containing protein, partial [Ignavibacteriaceae bacterium]